MLKYIVFGLVLLCLGNFLRSVVGQIGGVPQAGFGAGGLGAGVGAGGLGAGVGPGAGAGFGPGAGAGFGSGAGAGFGPGAGAGAGPGVGGGAGPGVGGGVGPGVGGGAGPDVGAGGAGGFVGRNVRNLPLDEMPPRPSHSKRGVVEEHRSDPMHRHQSMNDDSHVHHDGHNLN